MTTSGGGTGAASTFSRIISGALPARWESNEPSRRVVCFHNRLKWERVMLLVVPRVYMTQQQLWRNDTLSDALRMAVQFGEELCPEGFRVLSNFGKAAHQSQLHGHIHVISGLARTIESAELHGEVERHGNILTQRCRVDGAPHADRYRLDGSKSQHDLLTSEAVVELAEAAISHAESFSPGGFRLMANYLTNKTVVQGGPPGLFMLGGGQLDLYV
jgi:diadenosine tetraphosphate (Ap4A) HIT family hydrolase